MHIDVFFFLNNFHSIECHKPHVYLMSFCSILVSSVVGCAVAFGCFSAAAMVARRREFLYLAGVLSSGLSILFWLHFASSIFGGSAALFKFEVFVDSSSRFYDFSNRTLS